MSFAEPFGSEELIESARRAAVARSAFEELLDDVGPSLGLPDLDPHRTRRLRKAARRSVPDFRAAANSIGPSIESSPPTWTRLVQAADAAAAAAEAADAAYERSLAAERAALRAALLVPDVRKGIAYASSGIREQLDRYLRHRGTDLKPGRRRKLEESLASYVGRAVMKTSPLSTLTQLSWGAWTDDSSPEGRLVIDAHGASSRPTRIQLNRAGVTALLDRLVLQPPLAEHLSVRTNPTLDLRGSLFEFYRLSRPKNGRRLRASYVEELVRLPRTPALQLVWEITKGARLRTLGDVLDRIRTKAPASSRTQHMAYLQSLVDQGFLECVIPVEVHDPQYDRKVVEWLTSDPRPEVGALAAVLERILDLLDHFSSTDVQRRVEVQREVDRLYARLASDVALDAPAEATFFEDVACTDSRLRLPRPLLTDVEADLASLGRLSSIFQMDYEIRARLFEMWRSGMIAGETPLLQVFEAYQKILGEAGSSETSEILRALRERVRAAVREASEEAAHGVVVHWQEAEQAIGVVPPWVAWPTSMGFYLQRPGDAREPWVVNYSQEGNGRFFSRFTGLLPELAEAARTPTSDETEELVDLGVVLSWNVNLHQRLTKRCISYPGHYHDPAWASLEIPHLVVRCDERAGPRLFAKGSPVSLRPAHLGFLVPPWLPALTQLLRALGHIGPKPLPWFEEIVPGAGAMPRVPRLFWGNVMLYRERWNLFPGDVDGFPDAEPTSAFERIAAWMEQGRLPPRGFVTVDRLKPRLEDSANGRLGGDPPTRPRGKARKLGRKPHYLDFRSPLFLPRFQRLCGAVEHAVSIEEVYPLAGCALTQVNGQPRASELFAEIRVR